MEAFDPNVIRKYFSLPFRLFLPYRVVYKTVGKQSACHGLLFILSHDFRLSSSVGNNTRSHFSIKLHLFVLVCTLLHDLWDCACQHFTNYIIVLFVIIDRSYSTSRTAQKGSLKIGKKRRLLRRKSLDSSNNICPCSK